MKLNHVGVVVPSLEAAKEVYRSIWGVAESDISEMHYVAAFGANVVNIQLENTHLELIEPIEPGVFRDWLAKNPHGGTQHVCFEVENLVSACGDITERGGKIVGDPEASNFVIVHPKNTHGLIVELQGPRLPA